MKYIFALFLSLAFFTSHAQQKSKTKVTTDTLLNKLLEGIPKEMQAEFLKEYKSMSSKQKKQMLEFANIFAAMPQSSKKQLIQNIDTNYNNVVALKDFFNKLVPANYSIYIEFKPVEKLLGLDESVDFWVTKTDGEPAGRTPIFNEWDVELKSSKLDSLLSLTPLKRSDLLLLKGYLDKANCISITNDNVCKIGYARSGMGKYSYLIFDKPLTEEEIKEYNNGCEYIFYKDNIVLVYEGGAIGPQCFPGKD